jgi:Ca2+-transporting ATPase
MHVDEVAAELGSSPAGLSSQEASARLETTGPNQLREAPREPAWGMFLAQFHDFMIWVLIAAAALAGLQGEWVDTIAIAAILLLNAVLGFVQEYRAEQALAALREMSAPTAAVLRDGEEHMLPAAEVVPGDVIVLDAGDRIPADGRLVETAALQVIESALTGESEPVHKSIAPIADPHAALGDRVGMVFAGTAVAVGRARYLVTETGDKTEVGRIADLLSQQEEQATPLQQELQRVGKRIALLVLVVAALIFAEQIIALFAHTGDSIAEAFDDPAFVEGFTASLLIAVSLAVAAIPEGLPAVVTIALSLGVRRMAEHNAIVRRLTAVETLGSTTFICTDKTGTITRNVMTVKRLVVGSDGASITEEGGLEPAARTPDENDLALLLEMAAANNDARAAADGSFLGDPTEVALLRVARDLSPRHLHPRRVAEVPFDSERKRMTTVHGVDDERVAYVKGGADVVLSLCTQAQIRGEVVSLDDELRAKLSDTNEQLASSGFRTLAFAFRSLAPDEDAESQDVERDLTYVGILGLVDPARPEVGVALAACRRAGIAVAMVTGDHALTARAIAVDIGLLEAGAPDSAVVTGKDLGEMSEEELRDRAEEIRVYARVDPDDKLRIVRALKANGETVAMTGDGVNDAPALKRADIGVAMGKIGTDVAREASDMVLQDDNFATIVEAVSEGRSVFDNLRKVILFLLSCNMSEVLVVFTTAIVAALNPNFAITALLPLQLLWINLVTDGPPALALGVDPPDAGVMGRPPRNRKERILSGMALREIGLQGTVMTVVALSTVFIVGPYLDSSQAAERTMLFTALVLIQKLHAFNYRSETTTVFAKSALANRWLVLAFIATIMLQVAVVYWPPFQSLFETVPLTGAEWLGVVLASLVSLALMDIVKVADARRAAQRRADLPGNRSAA